jgi:hypothetical protein
VWEEVATRIREQTVAEIESRGETKTVLKRLVVAAQKPVVPVVKERLKRQTARTPGR